MEKTRGGRGGRSPIPNKLYFRIGEVSDIVGVKPYVLRYWESEFPDIKPTKSKSGQRLYKRRDVEMLLRIKGLLYDERFTINGARKRLKDGGKGEGREAAHEGEEELPRQLGVFDSVADRERGGRVSGSKESSKVLMKIRRDLVTLLDMVQSE